MTAPTPAPPRRILLVDDEPILRVALRRYFVRQGWEVDEAPDGDRGLAFLLGPDAAAYDVVLCDLRMPGVSGAEVYNRVAAQRPALVRRMIVSTGDPFEAERFGARTGCAVLHKPFEFAELSALVARVTGAA